MFFSVVLKSKPLPVKSASTTPMQFNLGKLNLDNLTTDRDTIFKSLKAEGIGVNVHYMPIHLHPFYKKLGFKKGDFKNAEKFSKSIITLPLHTLLTKKDVHYIVKNLNTL